MMHSKLGCMYVSDVCGGTTRDQKRGAKKAAMNVVEEDAECEMKEKKKKTTDDHNTIRYK